uniref:Uncharacterized protein n=1 Tax=Circular ssDNA virus sp. TaxID=2805939 RepID=A0A2Z4BSE5_9VIRU|nr:MAG: hypothetical protein [Circular ssDNA virus sp.]
MGDQFFFMEGITTLVLRGISGVGKTVLRKLLEKVLEKLGKRVKVISKDEYRRFLDEREGYHYTKEEEEKVSEWYRGEYREQAKRKDLQYIICDNTHVRESELLIPCTPTGRVSKIIIIEVGDIFSESKSSIPTAIVERQRKEMDNYETRHTLFRLCCQGASLINIPAFDATEEVAEEIIDDCEKDFI